MKNIINDILTGPGYSVDIGLNKIELKKIKEYVESKFLNNINKLYPEKIDVFKSAGIKKYHLNSDLVNHQISWPRQTRLFDAKGIDLILKTSFFNNLKKLFKDIIITSEIENKKPEIVWRIVRPNMVNDVGPIHTDEWFWKANKWQIPKNKKCIKVWVMLDGETNNSGLSVVPNSHKKLDWEYSFHKKDNIQKPLFDIEKYNLKPIILKTNPGNAVIFSYNLLHGGAITKGELCRLSLEFTLFVPK